MQASLLRQDVVEARRGEWQGFIIVVTSLSRWCLAAMAVVLATALLLPLVGHYARCEIVSGHRVFSASLLKVMAPRAGIVARMHGRDRTAVKADRIQASVSHAHKFSAAIAIHELIRWRCFKLLNVILAPEQDIDVRISLAWV